MALPLNSRQNGQEKPFLREDRGKGLFASSSALSLVSARQMAISRQGPLINQSQGSREAEIPQSPSLFSFLTLIGSTWLIVHEQYLSPGIHSSGSIGFRRKT